MGYKSPINYLFDFCEFNMVLATCSTAWKLILGRIYIRTLLYVFLISSKVNRSQIRVFSLIYNLGSDLWMYRILYSDLKSTGSHCSWNKTGIICSILWVLLAVGSLSERGGGIFQFISIVQSRNNKCLD